MKAVKAYFDNAATTRMAPEVLKEMLPFFSDEYGNPGSIHSMGDAATKAVREARTKIAKALNCLPSEIVFTSGGTESDNIAITGMASKGKRIVTSSIEHSAVLESCMHLRSTGYDVTVVGTDEYGMIDPDDLRKVMNDDVSLVSIMTANNVIGTIQRIREISDIVHEYGAYFHTDAVQAFTKTDTDVKRSGVDMLSISGHKIHGPKGIGALFVGDTHPEPIMFGGGQERGLRPSTENVPGIVGLGKACDVAISSMKKDIARMTAIRNKIIDDTLNIDGAALNGPSEGRLCNNAHFRFDGIKGSELVLKLSDEGIAASTASACSAGSTDPSHVMTAIGLTPDEALSSLRISLSKYTAEDEVEYLSEILPHIISKLRKRKK